MKVNVILCVCVFLMFLLSCKNRIDNKSDLLGTINCSYQKDMSIPLSKIAESVEFIPLQTNGNSFIGAICSIKTFNHKYYIGTGMNHLSQILVFNSEGSFLYKLDKIGTGKDEYSEIKDYDVIQEGVIAVVSHSDPRLLIYDIKKDTCILNKRIGNYPTNISYVNEYLYVFTKKMKVRRVSSDSEDVNPDENIILKYDLKGNLVESLFSPDELAVNKINYITPIKTFDASGNDIYFSYPWSDIIYRINDKTISGAYYLDYGKFAIPSKAFTNVNGILDIVKNIKENKGLFLTSSFSIQNDYIYTQFEDYEENGYILFYDLEKKKEIKAHYLVDDLYQKGMRYEINANLTMPKCIGDQVLIWCIDNEVLIKKYAEFKNRLSKEEWLDFEKCNPRIVNLFEHLKEDDNPTVLNMKLKLDI